MSILWISEEDVARLVTMREVMGAVEEAFKNHGLGRVQMPRKVYLDFPRYRGDLRAMPAYIEAMEMAGVKIVNSHADNPMSGLPAVAAVLVLNDPKTGMPLAVLSATLLTGLRTGAAGGIAARTLARKDSRVVGLVGCGRQAFRQLEALQLVLPVEQVKVWGLAREESERFLQSASSFGNLRVEICAQAKAACAADIVVTTTPSRRPVVLDPWIAPGTHINAIGADGPGKQELDVQILKRSRIIVDEIEQACHGGELNVPVSRGEITRQDIQAQLGEIIVGRKKGRETPQDVTVFDSTGLAIQDIAAGALVYRKALQAGAGKVLE